MFYKAKIKNENGVMEYPFDINSVKKPLYNKELTMLFFESDEDIVIDGVEYIEEMEYQSLKDEIDAESIAVEEVAQPTEIEVLKAENETLKQQQAQMNADFIALTDALAENGVL